MVKLSTANRNLALADSFTPHNQECLDTCDLDLGTAGPILLPGLNRIVAGGKEGRVYLLDTGRLGGFNTTIDDVKQCFKATENQNLSLQDPDHRKRCEDPQPCRQSWTKEVSKYPHIHGSPVVWQGTVPGSFLMYLWSEEDRLKAFRFENLLFRDAASNPLDCQVPGNASAVFQGDEISAPGMMPGGILSLSANGTDAASAILWASTPVGPSHVPISESSRYDTQPPIGQSQCNEWLWPTGKLSAFDANDLTPVWNSETTSSDSLGPRSYAKFVPPVIANGHVYMASTTFEIDPNRCVKGSSGRLFVFGFKRKP